MKILVVEDDQAVAHTLQLLMTGCNYAVDIASDGEAGLQMADALSYDLILLDVGLPKLDGISLCQQLRAKGCQSPILLLTGQGGGHQKAIALNAGADDYVVKPFDAEELIARVRALLRRGGLASQPTLSWGNLSIDPSSRRVAYGTHLLAVTPKEYAILELLLRTPQKTFSARVILDHVWTSLESPGEEAVRVHIKELRQKLAAVGAPRDFIKTQHRVGYQLNTRYSNFLAVQVEQQPTPPQIAELSVVNEELRVAVESFQYTQEKLRQQNEQLVVAQQMIALERQRYQDLFEFAPDAYLVTDMRGIIEAANCATSEMFQVDAPFLIGKPLIRFIAHRDRRDFYLRLTNFNFNPNWEAIIASGKADSFPVSIKVTSIKNWQDEIVGLRWLLRDIHICKETEQHLQADRHELEMRMMERTNELLLTNQTLKEREEFLSSIYNGANQGIFVIEVTQTNDFRYSSFNHLAEYLAGKGTQALEGQTPEEAFGATIGATFRQNYERCLQVGKSISYEENVIFDDHHTIWTLTTLSPLRNEQGRIYRIVGTAIDITDRKQAEVQLQEMSGALSNTVEGISRLDHQGHYIFVNEAYARMVGYEPQEMIGMHWQQTVHPDDQETLLAAYQQMLTAGKVEVEARGIRQDGSTFYKQVFMVVARNEQQLDGHYCFMKDVTDKHQLQVERQQAEQIIREQAALLDIASDAIFVRDLNHAILYWNRGAERLYGWQVTEAIGQKAHELLQEHDFPVDTVMHELLEQGEWRGEVSSITKAGKQVTVEARWTLVRDETGQPNCVLAVDTDITDKKLLEAQFYRAQRLESLGTLASGIAHDLNNVLTPILAIVQLLRLKHANLDHQFQELLQVLEDSAKRGASLIRQILTFARGTDGKCSPVPIAALLAEVVTVMQQTFPKNITIQQSALNPSLWLVSAEPTHLHQVLMNLCINARDGMPHGGILSLSAENFQVDDRFAQTTLDAQIGNYVVITIADTGSGIPPELRDRIFEPFFTTKESGQGTGLGLATALGIVKNYGGFLQVFSTVGRGTEMKVYLPAFEGLTTDDNRPETTLEGRGELVLVVDDDRAVQRGTQALLESHHYSTVAASDGLAAIALYARQQDEIKLVILDVMMPRMGGIALIRQLKEMNPQVKIIAMSGLVTKRETALATGANIFLSKPYSFEILLQTARDLINEQSLS